jgi:thiol-disulfide isomerase/thioredoxin
LELLKLKKKVYVGGMKLFWSFFFLVLGPYCFAKPLPPLKGINLLTGESLELEWRDHKKGVVLVFVSSTCPCSNSHIPHLIKLSLDFPEFKFLGIHSNKNESQTEAQVYFQSKSLPFPVIRDHNLEWADRLKALRTPHAYLINPKGEILYQGGVTSSADAEKADSFYLKVTLKNYLLGKKIDKSKSRVLGCQIARD